MLLVFVLVRCCTHDRNFNKDVKIVTNNAYNLCSMLPVCFEQFLVEYYNKKCTNSMASK